MTVSVNLFNEYSSKAVNGSDPACSSKAAFLALTVELHRGYPHMTSLPQKSQRRKFDSLAWEKFYWERPH
jgi:hypothetical protein